MRNRLKDANLRARRAYRGARMTARHRATRLQWARIHLRFTTRQWGSVLFSDECRIKLHCADGRSRVWRRRNERFTDPCVQEVDRWGGGSIHFWAGITRHNRTDLVVFNGNVTANVYINNVLRPVAIPFMRRHRLRTLQQDGARPHTAAVTRQFLQQNDVNVLDWPALSPDMSPIEHV